MKINLFAMLLLCLVTITDVQALDYYGANIADKDAPSSFMKFGIMGFHPIVTEVALNSYAEQCGLNFGDVILTVNNKPIRTTAELPQFKTDTIEMLVFSGNVRKNITINRLAIETEINKQLEASRKSTQKVYQKQVIEEVPDSAPAIKFDDAALEKKYGKSTPEQKAREKQLADRENMKHLGELKAKEDQQNELIRQREERDRREEQRKLSKVSCTGIPGECGPERVCLINNLTGNGQCMSEAEAERIQIQNARQSDVERKLNNVDRTTDENKRLLKYGF